MPDNVDHVRGFDSTRGYCSCLGKWIGSLISKSLNTLVGLPFRSSLFRFIAEKENCHLSFLSAMDPIEITSSDSDYCGMENDAEEDASPIREFLPAHTRTLPSLEATLSTHSRSSGFNEQACRVSSPKRVSTSNGVPLDVDLPQSRLQYSSNSVGNNDAFNCKVAEGEAYQNFKTKGIRSLPRNFMDVDALDEASNSKYLNALGKTLGNLNRSDDDDVVMLNSDGSKILPSSLIHGKSASTSQFVCPRDLVYRSSIIEERASENDERIFYQAALQDLQQPKLEATLPDGLMAVSLFRHQKIALAWMLQKETKSTNCLGGILADDQGLGKTISMIALIQMQKALQSNSKVKCQRNHKTEALNLDEDDDTGYSGLNNVKHNGISDDVKVNPVITSSQALPRRPTAGTLIVCPASVLRQWARELDYKVADQAKLSVLMYHGGNRTKDPVQLAKYDVVLTTYSIVANEVPKRPLVDEDGVEPRDGETYGLSSEFSESRKRKKTCNGTKRGSRFEKELVLPLDFDSGALAKVVWYRVILDEAQTIKNHRTRMARSCCSLRAKRRWCLSGTPIQNSIDDLYSYFRFLKCEPYCGYKSFCYSIKNFIARDSVSGYKKLQAILFPIMLRRTKETLIDGEPIIKLPPKSVHLTKVDFSTAERAFYLKLEAESHSKFKAYAAAGTVNQNYANILLMLLRLRQACDHPLLVKGFNSDSVGAVSVERAKRLSKDSLVGLLNILETSLAICHVCKDPPEDAVVTLCGHIFCYQCISEYITVDEHMCPTPQCKKSLRADIIFSGATLRSCICDVPDSASSISSYSTENSLIPSNEHASSKISAALQILQLHCKSNGSSSMACNENYGISSSQSTAAASHRMGDSASQSSGQAKAIIFSQWTRMMDLVEISLKQSCIRYRRLDGTMTLASRDKAVKDFNTDPQVTVMLMSLKAGNLGLNMVSASHVILLDLWWNPTTEDQAIDRAHRIGQTRPVIVSRITIKDTVEDRILALQEEKRKMVASAFGEDQSGGSATRLTVEDLHYLFTANRDRLP